MVRIIHAVVVLAVFSISTIADRQVVAFARYEVNGWVFEPSRLDSGGDVEAVFAWRAFSPADSRGIIESQYLECLASQEPQVMVYYPSGKKPDWVELGTESLEHSAENREGHWVRAAWKSPRSAMSTLLTFVQRRGELQKYSIISERFMPTGDADEAAFVPDDSFRVLGVPGGRIAGDPDMAASADTIADVAEFFRVALTAEDLVDAIGAGLKLEDGVAVVIQPWVGWVLADKSTVEENDLDEPVYDKETGAVASVGRFYLDSHDSRNEIAIGDCVCVYLRIRSEYHIEGDSVSPRTRTERRVMKCNDKAECMPGEAAVE